MEQSKYPPEYWDKWALKFKSYLNMRTQEGLDSLENVARICGVSVETARYWAIGTLKPTDEQVEKLARETGHHRYKEAWEAENRNTIRAWDAVTGQELKVEVI